MTVTDKLKIDVRIGNLNPYALSVRLTSPNAANGSVGFALPQGTFQIRPRSTISRSITITGQNITLDPTFVTFVVSAVYNGVKFGDSLSMPVKILPRGFPRQIAQGGSIGS